MTHLRLKLFGGLFFVAIVGIFLYYTFTPKPYSLDKLLPDYGFTTVAQKEALHDLYQKASEGKRWEKVFPSRATLDEVASDVLTLIQDTQAKFIVRKGTQERWEVQPLAWMNQETDKILADLKTLGLTTEVAPISQKVDAICILGATRKSMSIRVRYAESLLYNGWETHALILLAGERPASKDVDGTEAELAAIAADRGLKDWHALTETHLLEDLFAHSPLRKAKLKTNLKTYVIDTLAGDLSRPTTQTTVLALLEWLKTKPEIKTILLISNQPHVAYQEVIIRSIFKDQDSAVAFQVVGSGLFDPKEMKPLLEGLGSYLWAASPSVLAKLDLSEKAEKTKEAFHELYAKNPLLYRLLPPILRTGQTEATTPPTVTFRAFEVK